MLHRGVSTTFVAALALSVLGAGCSDTASTDSVGLVGDAPPTTAVAVDDLRLNELQYIGTHNSYHVAPEPRLFEAEKQVANELGDDASALGNIDSLGYTHDPLSAQLDQGIRAFELDVAADPEGGLYANPLAPAFLQIDNAVMPTGMDQPGYKVIHIQDIDFISTCSTFVACLTEIDDWSDANENHLPIFIQVEVKDDMLPAPIDVTQVVPIGPAELDTLDAEIRSVFDEDELITPDDVRGDAGTLNEAVTSGAGWPTVGESRGKVLFFLDNGGHVHDHYLEGHADLEGRVAFTSAAEDGDADRAIVKLNDPTDATIAEAVAAGYIVRTRADADLIESWTNETAQRDAALASGAQIVSTDFPKAKAAASGYVVTFGDTPEVRCNAVRVRSCPTAPIEG